MSVLEKVDRLQKSSKPASIAMATVKKFSEDKSTNLAALIAFWGFFSIFPLFLVLVTLLAYFLPASDKESVLGHVAQLLPLLDPNSVSRLHGQWWTLVLGLLTALWSGIGVVRTAELAFNSVWEVPRKEQPGMVQQILRALLVLATIGFGLVLSTILSGFVVSTANGVNLGVAGRAGGYVLAAVFDVGLFMAAFKILTGHPDMTMRTVLPGALLSGVAFFVLQQLSAFIISQHLKSASSTYGHFATVITLLWWLYLQSIITLLGAQLNVVLAQRLYPRSLVHAPQTEADHRVARA